MRNFTLLLLALMVGTFVSAQTSSGVWESIDELQIQLEDQAVKTHLPLQYQTYQLDFSEMQNQLSQTPTKSQLSSKKALEVDLPLADGQIMTFEIVEESVMMPKLAAKFPNIRSYQGVGKNNAAYSIRLDCNTLGLFAKIRSPQGIMVIEPYAAKQKEYYMTFFRKDYISTNHDKSCGVKGGGAIDFENPIDADEIAPHLEDSEPYIQAKVNGNVNHRTYRMAIAATAEYTDEIGGVPNMMSRIATAVNTMNEIYQRELAVTFILIDNNEQLIQTDVATQPYTNVSASAGMLPQNQAALVAALGVDGFDIGHVFTVECSDDNLGIASLQSLCNDDNKGQGVTCGYSNDIILMVSETMSHEVGHQFGATHTWDYCGPGNDNRTSTTAWEPGSGTTIMSYGGVCGQWNLQNGTDTYFHTGTLIQVNAFLDGAGGSCAATGTVDNDLPSVVLPYSNGFYIPINTPFMLTAEGTDPDGDGLNYCWDQLNRHNEETVLGTQQGTSPSFRSFPPNANPTRVFPNQLAIILNNTFNLDDELLPSYTRNLKFRCSVRDDVADASGVVWSEELSFEATSEAGPFEVMNPNTSSVSWEAGTLAEVAWDVAKTDLAPVNCENVDIFLSIDGGFNFEHPLAVNVPNSGSRMVVVPNFVTTNARVMVKAADNIFFDMSNASFKIIPATNPGFAFDAGPFAQRSCLPDDIFIDIYTDSLLGYDSLINYSVTGLPTGAIATFDPNPARASQEVSLTIDVTGLSDSGTDMLMVVAEGPNLPAQSREVNIDYITNDFSALMLDSPAPNETGVAEVPDFSWTNLPGADSYTIEIATSPAFGSSIIETKSGITDGTYTPTSILQKSTVYYWRITPKNICGTGTPTAISVFQTENLNCNVFESGEENISIPAQANNTITSTINIGNGGSIIDINVSNIDISYSPIKALKLELESPGNKKVVLFEENCGNTSGMDIGFDNEAPNPIAMTCPPTGGGVAKPVGDLGSLYNDDASGDWVITVTTESSGFSPGQFNEWSLEVCSNSSVSGPTLVTNKVLPILANDAQWVSNGFLRVTDTEQNSLELIYTIVEDPVYGHLEHKDGTMIRVGSNFAQADLDNNRIKYVHDGAMVTADGFFFIVEDGTGGFIGKTEFKVEIGDNNDPLSTTEPLAIQWGLFPNPAQDMVHLNLEQAADQQLIVKVLNVQGKLIDQSQINKGDQQIKLSVSHWPAGMYFIEIGNRTGISTQKLIIQR